MKLTTTDLKDIRAYFAISQQQLADKLNVSQSYIAHMERGAEPIPPYVAKKLGITYKRLIAIKQAKEERKAFLK